MNKVYLCSTELTCNSNLVDTARMERYLKLNHWDVVKDIDQCDCAIINTCSFVSSSLNRAQAVVDQISKKRDIPLYVVGCAVKNQTIAANYHQCHLLANYGELDRYFYRAVAYQNTNDHLAFSGDLPTPSSFKTLSRSLQMAVAKLLLGNGKHYQFIAGLVNRESKFYVEIAKGCQFQCSFCSIHLARGKTASRSVSDILADIAQAPQGQTVCLVAHDCGSYGIDIGTDLADLVTDINRKFPTLRIELSLINPFWLAKYPALFLHLFETNCIDSVCFPVQSSNDQMLKLMKRGYSYHEVLEVIKKIRQVSPHTFIWTHFLVGHPQENISVFLSYFKEIQHFHIARIFFYSERKNTPSSQMVGKVHPISKFLRWLLLGTYSKIFFVLSRFKREEGRFAK